MSWSSVSVSGSESLRKIAVLVRGVLVVIGLVLGLVLVDIFEFLHRKRAGVEL